MVSPRIFFSFGHQMDHVHKIIKICPVVSSSLLGINGLTGSGSHKKDLGHRNYILRMTSAPMG